MRFSLHVAVGVAAAMALCATARAQPIAGAGPPSKTLERAIKLYDRQDFYSASIELMKVVDGESGDDTANKQRAAFFLGKSVYQLKYHVAALAYFDRLANDPRHPYRQPSIKWLVAIAEALPGDPTRYVLRQYTAADADTGFDDNTRDLFRYHLGRIQAVTSAPAAVATLQSIAPSSAQHPRAALELAILAFQAQKIDEALRELAAATADPATSEEAIRTLAAWTRRLGVATRAREPLQALARNNAYAALENSRLTVEGSSNALAGVSIEAFDAVAITAACRKPTTGDARDAIAQTIRDARERIAKLRRYDDNAEIFEAMRKQRDVAVLAIGLGDRTVRDHITFVNELAHELELVAHADKAWQSTQVAAEIMQELAVQQSVAQADLGKLYGERLERLDNDLVALAQFFFGRGAVRLGPTGDIVVREELCTRVVGAVVHVASSGPGPQPIAPPPPHAQGCGGCASGGSTGFAAIAVVLLFARRRSARR